MVRARLRQCILAGSVVLGSLWLDASLAHAEEAIDTVWLTNGGRVRGSVMVDDAKVVSIKLADGKTREIARAEVMRIEYANAAAAATETAPKPKAKVKVEAPEPSEEAEAEAEAPRPKKRSKRRYDSMDNADRSPEDRELDESKRARRQTGAKRMVAAGGTLTAIGWCAVLGGLFAVAFGAAGGDEGPVVGGALVTGFSLPLAITGSVLLGVGVRMRRNSTSAFISDDRTEWDAAWQPEVPALEAPPLSLTFSF